MKTSELTGPALAYAVGVAEGCKVEYWHTKGVAILFPGAPRAVPWNPHSDWAQGGPIIERECIDLIRSYNNGVPRTGEDACRAQIAFIGGEFVVGSMLAYGPTPLIAAMRCYVASKLGDEVEIPEGLK